MRLKGGLGNQMFQYACGRAVAARNDDRLALDLTYLLDRRPGSSIVFREYGLDLFPIRARLSGLSTFAMYAPLPYLWLALGEAGHHLRRETLVQETPDFRIDELPTGRNLFLDGYWQDERFFGGIQNEVREVFTSLPDASPASRNLLAAIQRPGSVCLNVRRTDFVHHGGSANAHGFVGLDYYERAVRLVEDRVGNPRLFVFSDDVSWCKENLRFALPTTIVGHEHAGDRFGQYLVLMTACEHFVIPNSTFGWWAAWLGEEAGTVIVAPKRWSPREGTPDPVPDRWARV